MSNIKSSILIVEDESYIKKVLETALAAGGYRTISAVTGAQARSSISSHMPDMVLLDLGLPDMDGVKLLKELRQWSAMPVIVVSARSTERDKILALDNGADDYITKPFSAPELLARIRAVLRRNSSGSANDDTYCVGDFNIDFNKRIVNINNETIRLTQVEYRIVELLARNPGKVLTYDYIMSNIWGPYADSENNRILRVNMSHIRKKLEPDSMKPRYILTEIGVGYRMAE